MKYYIIAGEASGDLHGSNLIKALKQHDTDAQLRCWGGEKMEAAGAILVKHYRDLAFMGFWEVLVNLRTIFRNLAQAKKDILDYQPDVLILIDYPGFNLRLAKFARKHNIRVFYYISPQLWAWKSGRVRTLQSSVDKLFVILPFEEEFYAKYNYPVDFVGHPLLDVLHKKRPIPSEDEFLEKHGLNEKPIIALLPGSRKQEIKKMLHIMMKVVRDFPEHQFVVAGAPSIHEDFYRDIIGGHDVRLISEQTYDLLSHASAALVTSGTATLETALIGVPEVVCYKGSRISFWIAGRLVHVSYISLVNLIMDRCVVTELIQHLLTPQRLKEEIRKLLDPEIRKKMLDDYQALRNKLGGGGASDRTAKLMIQYLNKKRVIQPEKN